MLSLLAEIEQLKRDLEYSRLAEQSSARSSAVAWDCYMRVPRWIRWVFHQTCWRGVFK